MRWHLNDAASTGPFSSLRRCIQKNPAPSHREVKSHTWVSLTSFVVVVVLSLSCSAQAFSSCSSRGYSLVAMHRLVIVIIFLLMTQALGIPAAVAVALGLWGTAQSLWRRGLVAPRPVKSSWIRNWPHMPCFGRWILNHWTTREVPHWLLLITVTTLTFLTLSLFLELIYTSNYFP